uniref:Uncharacterized protein LOC102804448 n=1 Tax=Saccoglossus kowalevskii TaxID=10224 RepID=A0ABM0MA14_SACKO|nr:PREDICTED: uncharacterized protein LOC102804448 [Saccoglossus kowalevskii]
MSFFRLLRIKSAMFVLTTVVVFAVIGLDFVFKKYHLESRKVRYRLHGANQNISLYGDNVNMTRGNQHDEDKHGVVERYGGAQNIQEPNNSVHGENHKYQSNLENEQWYNVIYRTIPCGNAEINTILSPRRHYLKIRNRTVVEDSIYWSKEFEKLIPEEKRNKMEPPKSQLGRANVMYIARSDDKHKCGEFGSQNNAYVILDDGTEWCARYKKPCFILGEVMAYMFTKWMCMNYIPPLILTKPDPRTHLWGSKTVKKFMKEHEWNSNNTISMTQWLPSIKRSKAPPIINTNNGLIHVDNPAFKNITEQQILDLMVYSDTVVIDNLMGVTDRVLAMYLQKPCPQRSIRNCFVDENRNTWWLDNEAAFLIGYLKQYVHYVQLNETLKTVCIFRRQTVSKIIQLHQIKDAPLLLWKLVGKYKNIIGIDWIPGTPMTCESNSYIRWAELFKERIEDVYRWIVRCSKDKYESLLNEYQTNL